MEPFLVQVDNLTTTLRLCRSDYYKAAAAAAGRLRVIRVAVRGSF